MPTTALPGGEVTALGPQAASTPWGAEDATARDAGSGEATFAGPAFGRSEHGPRRLGRHRDGRGPRARAVDRLDPGSERQGAGAGGGWFGSVGGGWLAGSVAGVDSTVGGGSTGCVATVSLFFPLNS